MINLVIAADFLLSGLLLQQRAILNRRMRFITLTGVQLVARVVAVAVAIWLAWRGAGYWALVAMTLVNTLATAAGLWIVTGWMPSLPGHGAGVGGVRGMLGFGANLTGFQMLNYLTRNLDNLLIGKFVGEAALGLYVKAYSLLMLPLTQLNSPLTAVMVPTLSRLQDQPARFARGYLRGVSLSMMVTAPLTAFLFFWSEEMIRLVLGPQWTAAAPIFRILALAAILQPLGNTTGWLLIPMGRADRLLRWKLMTCWFTPLLFVIGVLWHGVEGVAWALVIGVAVVTVPTIWYSARGTAVRVLPVLGVSLRPVVAAVAANLLLIALLHGRVHVLVALLVLPAVYLVVLCGVHGGLTPLRELRDLYQAITRRDTARIA